MAKAAMETRYLLDRGDWQGAAAMPMNPTGAPMADSIYRFSRGLGMARSGNVAGAKAEIEAMKAVAHRAAARRSILLGRPHRRADAGYFRLGGGEGGRARPGGAVHARGR